ncbi:prepilin-type N-terminal cleavage/methylation domain-containing protein [Candidatus Gracilibacteria bacterium]|nr:prepilin-type N-terminal cleavage/methylation domain-containing protein [Candidatus Gracilibacteria bacterium]MCF7856049.1 prepilin-type N-terminal cleavage/methylation domain-containing protein [Candidatus Gracilibacteria bacterium]MCF7896396.1 prepilin-type N-terminal cleavage/methylation domain-containing protein [Candidatus Gracilibacteria bacterium]
MSQFSTKFRSQKGFTLVEVIVAISIFLIVIAATTGMFTDAFATKRKAELSRTLYEESRIVLERIVKEVRRGTIDYEEYFSRTQVGSTAPGKNYGLYAAKFYQNCAILPCVDDLAKSEVTRFSENIGENTSALGSALSTNLQTELYLITAEGNEKTIIKTENDVLEKRIVMLKLPGGDSDADGQIDEWIIYNGATKPSPSQFWDFCSTYIANECSLFKFQKIQPDSINITSLKFYISPLEDPRKAFAEFTDDIQQQPHVTIILTAEPSGAYSRGIRGDLPTVTLQTTVAARAQNEVKSLNP